MEENLSLIIDNTAEEEASFRASVDQTLKQVIGFYIEEDLVANKVSKSARPEFIRHKLLFYSEAVRLGLLVLIPELASGDFKINNRFGEKHYFYEGDILRWRILPTLDDPFEKAKFFKETRRLGVETEGETEIGTDSELVNYALEEGKKAITNDYNNFIMVAKKIDDLGRVINILRQGVAKFVDEASTTNIIDSDVCPLSTIEVTKKVWGDCKESEDPKLTFVENYYGRVFTETDVMRVNLFGDQAGLLNDFFGKSKKRGGNTFLALFLISDKISYADLFVPGADLDEAKRAVSYIKKCRQEAKDLFPKMIRFAIQGRLDQLSPSLLEALRIGGVSPSLGVEFIAKFVQQQLIKPLEIESHVDSEGKPVDFAIGDVIYDNYFEINKKKK